MKRRQYAIDAGRVIAQELGLDFRMLSGLRRTRKEAEARRVFARAMYERGYAQADIARALKKSEWAVHLMLCSPEKRKRVLFEIKLRRAMKDKDPVYALENAQTVGEEFAALRRMRAARLEGGAAST